MALSSIEKQLAGLAASLPRTDAVLQMLLRVTDLHQVSVGLNITVLVDGYLIRGNLMGSPRYAAQLEAGLEAGILETVQRYGEDDPRGMAAEAWRAAMAGKFSEQARESDEAEESHFKAMEKIADDEGVSIDAIGFENLPDDVALTEIFRTASRSVLTLENAVLLVPPMFREDPIGVVRVHTSQIAAWWTRTEPADVPPGPESVTSPS
jgi:hypothetical protein